MTNAIITAEEATIPATLSDYVNQYRHYAKKTVESVILLGKTVFDADKFLSQDDFITFCDEVKLYPNGPTYRKLRTIGKMSNRFTDHYDVLPSSWTTVYELAKMKNSEFNKLIDGNVLHKEVTSKEIKNALDENNNEKKEKNTVTLTLKLVAKNSQLMFQMEQEMNKIAKRYGVKLEIDNLELHKQWEEIEKRMHIAA